MRQGCTPFHTQVPGAINSSACIQTGDKIKVFFPRKLPFVWHHGTRVTTSSVLPKRLWSPRGLSKPSLQSVSQGTLPPAPGVLSQ